jgi:hypothetical protein
MPKGLRNPAEEIPLGMVGGGGGGVGRFIDKAVPAATLAGFVGAGAKLTDLKAKNAEKRRAEEEATREAEAELKRESRRGMKSGGKTASSRADGCCQRGKTRGKMV